MLGGLLLIDSHCHLDPQAFGSWNEIDAVITRARNAGVEILISIGSGYGIESAQRVMKLIENYDDIYAVVGIHPHDSKGWTEKSAEELRLYCQHSKVVAVGEMGLDYHYNFSTPEAQRKAFREQLRLARTLNLPVVIHDRDSNGEVLEILQDEDAFEHGVLFHCFCGGVVEMESIIKLGGYISLPGIVTFKNGQQMREVAKKVPIENLLIETDSPFLTPVPHRGKRNEPQYVEFVAEAIALEKDCSKKEIQNATSTNAIRFFNLPYSSFDLNSQLCGN
jgi:TatD DNase family protein